jgi:flavin reductase (DIM6/NTAB) family NADH-FMN oxidoreductase RutF
MGDEMTRDRFRRACGYWATGVSIITTIGRDGKPYGLTMNGITSLSLEPPLFLICVDERSGTLDALKHSGVFCINVLREDQQALADVFAGKGDDKFNGVSHERYGAGAPHLHGAIMAVECRVSEIMTGGGHEIVIGEARAILISEEQDAAPLLFYRGEYGRLGD